MSERILTDATEPIVVLAVDSAGAPLTGLADLFVRIRRESDGLWFDWTDLDFVTFGAATTPNQALTEIDAANFPGYYEVTGGWDLSTITNQTADDDYYVLAIQTPGTNAILPGAGLLREGQYVDDLPNILADTADMQPKLGAPAADVSADIAAIKAETALIVADTADMQPKLGTPAGADISADIAAIKADTVTIIADVAALDLASDRCVLGVSYAPLTPQVRLSVSLERNGVPVTAGLLSASVVWYKPDGTALFTASGGAVADAQGQFDLVSATALDSNTAYYANVTVTDGVGAVTTRVKVPTVG